jgi:hypothetical protein
MRYTLKMSASWTIAAEARAFRETKKIEEMIEKDPKARESWVKRQLVLEEMEELSGVGDEETAESV